MAISVISQLTNVVAKFCAIVKICKYKGLHEGHHFILIAMDMHDAPGRDMDHFITECGRFSIIDNRKVIYPCIFAFSFINNMLVLLFNML